MLKSMKRSSHFWAKIVGGTVSPPPLHRKTIYRASQRWRWRPAWIGRSGGATCALTFQPSNHSFIQVFEKQLLDFALAA
jgi:hypothetical protein